MSTTFPRDFQTNLPGFGGDPSKDRAEHRSLLRKVPVILVHGNTAFALHHQYGMQMLKAFLRGAGYQDCEVWAMSYLGPSGSYNPIDPHTQNIDAFRTFVDRVRDYLGAPRLDFIAHSLGCGMVNAYLRGLQADGRWDNARHRLDQVGTFVSLAGATYGLPPRGSEFEHGGPFETESHRFHGVTDDTPRGSSRRHAQKAPVQSWQEVTPLDNDEIRYVAITAEGDLVDLQQKDTGRREGADLNERVYLGPWVKGHEKVIKSQTVFHLVQPYLNQYPPGPRVRISVDKPSGTYGSALRIAIAVEPASSRVSYRAVRRKHWVQGGHLVSAPQGEALSGTLSDQQALLLPSDGLWDVSFSADGADRVTRRYAVNVAAPEVEILTDNTRRFCGRLLVQARSSTGTVFHSTDGVYWGLGPGVELNGTETVSFIAIDGDGRASEIVCRDYQKAVPWTAYETAALTRHFLGQRLSIEEYAALERSLGAGALATQLTLYDVGGRWVLDPEAPERPLAPAASRAAPAREVPLIRASVPSGRVVQAIEPVITAQSESGAGLLVAYTTDGSDPSDLANPARASFTGSQAFRFEGNGHHAVLCCTRDGAGRLVFAAFAWAIDDRQYPITGISPACGGVYAGRAEVELHVSRPCRWTRYTTDGSEPSEAAGTLYSPGGKIALSESTRLKWRSQDDAGRTEPTRSALFTIVPADTSAAFASDAQRGGTVIALASGTFAVVPCADVVVGSEAGYGESRAILHFDTSSLPDNVTVTAAHLELELLSMSGELGAGAAPIWIDVATGCFAGPRALEARAWGAPARAEAVAQLGSFTLGVQASTDFSDAGLAAIQRGGVTQLRLRLDAPPGAARSVRFNAGPGARLCICIAPTRAAAAVPGLGGAG